MSEDDQDADDSEPTCVTEEDLMRNFPTFTFSEKLKKRLYKAWRTSVIVKLLDKSIGYKALLARLQFLWVKRGVVNLIDIGYGFFVVKFTNSDDYENARTGGPWIIYDHYLTVRPWEPNFIPIRAEIDRVAVWVRIPNVVLECYNHEALRIIGDRIGETLKVDMNTSSHLRGRYARICVLVDLRKQLMSGFRLNGEDYFLEYEGLHLLCNNCGLYGHVGVSCPLRKKSQEDQRGKQQDEALNQEAVQTTPPSEVDIHSYRDQWRTVQRTKRPKKMKEVKEGPLNQDVRGSRFGVLANEDVLQGKDTADVVHDASDKVVESQRVNSKAAVVQVLRREKKGPKPLALSGVAQVEKKHEAVIGGPHESKTRVEKRQREVRNGELIMLTEDEIKNGGIARGINRENLEELAEKWAPVESINKGEAQWDGGRQENDAMREDDLGSGDTPMRADCDGPSIEYGGDIEGEVVSLVPETQ